MTKEHQPEYPGQDMDPRNVFIRELGAKIAEAEASLPSLNGTEREAKEEEIKKMKRDKERAIAEF